MVWGVVALFALQDSSTPYDVLSFLGGKENILRQFVASTDEERKRLARDLTSWLEPHIRFGTSQTELQQLVSRRLSACRALTIQDRFRPDAMRDPQYQPLALPDRYYREMYDATLDLLQFDLQRGLNRASITEADSAVVHAQIEQLSAECRRLLSDQIVGPGAIPIIEDAIASLRNSLMRTIGPPFGAIAAPVEEGRMRMIMSELEVGITSSPPVEYPSEIEIDLATHNAEQFDEDQRQAVQITRTKLALIEDKIELATKGFEAYVEWSWPERASFARRVDRADESARLYLVEAHTKHRVLISGLARAAARDFTEKVRRDWHESRRNPERPERPNGHRPEDSVQIRLENNIPGGEENRDPIEGEDQGRWWIFVLLVVVSLVAIFGTALRRAGTRFR